MNNKKVVLVVGAGDATGGAIAKRFANEGFTACVTRRSADKLQPLVDAIVAEGGEAHGFACDCLLYTSPSPRDGLLSRMPSSA